MSLGAAALTFPLIRLACGTGWAWATEAQGEVGDLAFKSQPGVGLICSCCDLITYTKTDLDQQHC